MRARCFLAETQRAAAYLSRVRLVYRSFVRYPLLRLASLILVMRGNGDTCTDHTSGSSTFAPHIRRRAPTNEIHALAFACIPDAAHSFEIYGRNKLHEKMPNACRNSNAYKNIRIHFLISGRSRGASTHKIFNEFYINID